MGEVSYSLCVLERKHNEVDSQRKVAWDLIVKYVPRIFGFVDEFLLVLLGSFTVIPYCR